jgi:hypothetical protein
LYRQNYDATGHAATAISASPINAVTRLKGIFG